MISILIPTYNRLDHLKNSLQMYEDMYAGKVDFEICIYDDGSKEGERADSIDLRKFSYPLKLHSIPPKGQWRPPAVALNHLAYKMAKGEILAITCPEVVHKDPVLERVEKRPGVWSTSACQVHGEGGNSWWQTHPDLQHQPIYYFGAITKEDLFRVGGFREGLPLGGEDGDFTDRLAIYGFKLYWLGMVEHQWHGKN